MSKRRRDNVCRLVRLFEGAKNHNKLKVAQMPGNHSTMKHALFFSITNIIIDIYRSMEILRYISR